MKAAKGWALAHDGVILGTYFGYSQQQLKSQVLAYSGLPWDVAKAKGYRIVRAEVRRIEPKAPRPKGGGKTLSQIVDEIDREGGRKYPKKGAGHG